MLVVFNSSVKKEVTVITLIGNETLSFSFQYLQLRQRTPYACFGDGSVISSR